jgi:hypothetical protein
MLMMLAATLCDLTQKQMRLFFNVMLGAHKAEKRSASFQIGADRLKINDLKYTQVSLKTQMFKGISIVNINKIEELNN